MMESPGASLDPSSAEKSALLQQLARLESQRADLLALLPAHSIPPALIATLDNMDEQVTALQRELAALSASDPQDSVTKS
jgi:hypothetical protein